MKVLLICKEYYTNKSLLEDKFGRLYHLPVGLTKLGMDVSVIALDYRSKEEKSKIYENTTFQTLLFKPHILIKNIKELYQLTHSIKPDIIIASGDSHIGFISLKISKTLRCRFIFDVYDYYPAFKSNKIPGMSYLFWLTVKQADTIICASEPLKEKLIKDNTNTYVILNGVDTSIFRPMDKMKARQNIHLDAETGPIVGYFGSITKNRFPILIDACRLLKINYPMIKILIAGKNTDIDLKNEIFIYLGELTQEEIPILINSCDVVTIPYLNEDFNNYCGACKIPEYLACQVPIVATDVSNHRDFFSIQTYSITKPNPKDFATAIANQIKNPYIDNFNENFTWEKISQKLHRIIIT